MLAAQVHATTVLKQSLSDTWEFDGTAWSRRASALGPLPWPSYTSVAYYDRQRERVVLLNSSQYVIWSWDGATWTREGLLIGNGGGYIEAVYDAARRRGVAISAGQTRLVISGLPAVTAGPHAAVAVRVGGAVTLAGSVPAPAPPATILGWRRGRTALSDAADPRLSGSDTMTLTITGLRRADSGEYRLYAQNTCGVGASEPVSLTVLCPADADSSGETDANDLSEFLNLWYSAITSGVTPPRPRGADFDADGEVNANDISAYLNAWYAEVAAGGGC